MIKKFNPSDLLASGQDSTVKQPEPQQERLQIRQELKNIRASMKTPAKPYTERCHG